MAAEAAPPTLVELVQRHEVALRRHLIGMLGQEDDADDVLQQVWITAHQRPPYSGPGSNTRAWLYRVATNAALDRLARSRRRRAALAGLGARLEPEAQPGPDAGADVLTTEARVRIRRQVARLPRKQREAVWLRWALGSDYSEIARRLDCSEDSARANVYNGMKRLRVELLDLYEEECRQ